MNKPLQSGQRIGGAIGDTSKIPPFDNKSNSVIPPDVLAILESECDGLTFGEVSLVIKLHDGQARFEITRTRSIVPGKASSGAEFPVRSVVVK